MREYFIHDGQSEKGPFDILQLKLENLKKETPLWYEGLENWTTVGEVEELKSFIQSKPTPPPLNKNTEQKLPPKKEEANYSSSITKPVEQPKKVSFTRELVVTGFIIAIGIISWLIYQSKDNSEKLNNVEQKVTQQQNEQSQKDQEQIIAERAKQAEKNRINDQLTEKYMGYRNSWENFIESSHNTFSVGLLGGISDLSINVSNSTDKSIDEVQVKVNYITSGGYTFQSENISVSNIGPNSTKTVSAPSSSRGSDITQEIISISAKSFHFCYPNGMPDNKNIDPYFCK